jgi:hypothetical protein
MSDMQAGANGRGKPDGKTGIRTKRRKVRAILRDGVEAALRADAEVLENCKPKTPMGRIVRGLVLEAGKGRMTAFKALMSLVDSEPDAPDSEDAQALADEPAWDWSADGVWETMPEAEAEKQDKEQYVADDRWPDGPQAELKRRLERLLQGNEADKARAAAIIAHLRAESAAEEAATWAALVT